MPVAVHLTVPAIFVLKPCHFRVKTSFFPRGALPRTPPGLTPRTVI